MNSGSALGGEVVAEVVWATSDGRRLVEVVELLLVEFLGLGKYSRQVVLNELLERHLLQGFMNYWLILRR